MAGLRPRTSPITQLQPQAAPKSPGEPWRPPPFETPNGTALAMSQGRIFTEDGEYDFKYYIRRSSTILGRSESNYAPNLLVPASKDADIRLGIFNTLSRIHAYI